VLSKLSSFESEDWGITRVRGVVELSLVIDEIIMRFEAMRAAGIRAGASLGEEIFFFFKGYSWFKGL
jgi:hypothetical protein